MELSMLSVLVCVAIGGISGVVAALCGVGGGIIMVPAFVFFLRLDQKHAAATSLAAIILMATAASIKNTGNSLVDWKVAVPTALAGAVVSWFAADWLKHLSNTTLTRMFAMLVIVMGIHMLWTTRGKAPAKPEVTAPAAEPVAERGQ